MEPVHPEVLNGRNPWWREAWMKLSPSQRTAVWDAMKLGRRVPDDDLLPFVYGLMAIERRTLRWIWPRFIWVEGITGVWIYFACFRIATPRWECWMFVALAFAGVIALIIRLLMGRRRLRRAEGSNLWGGPSLEDSSV